MTNYLHVHMTLTKEVILDHLYDRKQQRALDHEQRGLGTIRCIVEFDRRQGVAPIDAIFRIF